jgi:hypothetical protein
VFSEELTDKYSLTKGLHKKWETRVECRTLRRRRLLILSDVQIARVYQLSPHSKASTTAADLLEYVSFIPATIRSQI